MTHQAKTIEDLPDEVLMKIFDALPVENLLTCECVCRRWWSLARDTSIWKKIPIAYSGKPGLTDISRRNFKIILSHCDCILCLKIQYIYSYPIIQSIIEKCDNLISLELVMCRVEKEFEEDILQWKKLQKLNLKNSVVLSNSGDITIPFETFEHLTHLSLSDFGLNSTNCYSLLNCKYLTQIMIEKIKNLDLEFIRQLIITKTNSIHTLHIYGGNAINDECMALLSQCCKLKDLAIIRCENLSDDGFMELSKLKRIDHLQIWNNNNFTEKALLHTLKCSNLYKLNSLSLSRIRNVSPTTVDVISEHYKDLKFLALYQCKKIINTDYEKQLKSKFRNIDVVLY